jgi:hypothetical protein
MKPITFDRGLTRLLVSATLAALSTACSELARSDRSPAFLVIEMLEAASGAEPEQFGNVLNSDVETIIEQQTNGQSIEVPSVFSDSGRATFRLGLKNPGTSTNPMTPSPLNEITITRYRVAFRRADGRSTPGLDVPYPFDGAVTLTVPAEGAASVTFALVRHQAKLEPPLSRLRRGGSGNIISTIAEVTFYGRDQAGNDVAVGGLLSVNFGDFADPR